MVLKRFWVFSLLAVLFLGCHKKSQDSRIDKGSEELQRIQAQAEIVSEMIRVAFDLSEGVELQEFKGLLQSVAEGASLEGIYNGLTHSDRYRKKEIESKAASSKALKAFGEILHGVEKDRKVPRAYEAQDALPLALPLDPASPPPAVESVVYDSPRNSPNRLLSADEYSRLFVGASVFTLKRVLSDALLSVAAERGQTSDNFHNWYAEKAVYLSSFGVDFGLPQRNLNQIDFHRSWALRSPEGLAKWELLNRIHRILNQFQKG